VKFFAALIVSMFAFAALSLPGAAHANPPALIYGVKTAYSPGAITTNAQVTTTVAVVGAVLGDVCDASYSVSLAAVHMACEVTAADVATVYLINITGGTLTPTASSTVRVVVTPITR